MVAHEAAGQRELLPLTERDLDAVVPRDAELRVEPAASRSTTSRAPARSTAASIAGWSSSRSRSPSPTVSRGTQLEPEEVLERAGEARPPLLGGHAREVDAVDRDRARRRLVEAAQQLHERRLARAVLADDRDHRAGGEVEVDVVEHEPVGARDSGTRRVRGGCRPRCARARADRRARRWRRA